MKQNFETGKAPTLNFMECGGDVTVKGSDSIHVQLKGDEIEVNEKETGLNIHAQNDVKANVPTASAVHFQQVMGDLSVKGMSGQIGAEEVNGSLLVRSGSALQIGSVHGDMSAVSILDHVKVDLVSGSLVAKKVDGISAGRVHGDFSAKAVNGDLNASEVSGNLGVRDCTGDLTADKVMGDAKIRRVHGALNLKEVMGSVHMVSGLPAGKHHIKAYGDVVIHWPDDQPAQFLIECRGSIRNRLGIENSSTEHNKFEGQIGDGSAVIIVEAYGDVRLKSINDEIDSNTVFWDDISFDLDLDLDQLGEKISTRLDDLSSRLNSKFGPGFADSIANKVGVSIERALGKLENAQVKVVRPGDFSFSRRPPTPPKAPKPPKNKAAEKSEQLKILEMLEAGTITVEDASTLLKALE